MSTPPISPIVRRPDIVATESAPRPTPAPPKVPFKEALARVGQTAEAAVNVLPGGPLLSTALRGAAVPMTAGPFTPLSAAGATATVSTAAEGPGGVGAATSGLSGIAADPQAALQQAQTNEMQMLVLQEEVSAQQNRFTTLSNVMKSESDTEKSAINNIK